MKRTLAVDEILLLLERFAPDAVPAFVDAFVDVAARRRSACAISVTPALWRGSVVRMKSSNETSSCAHVRAELLLHPIAVRERIEPLLDRAPEHVLRVLVVAHQETRLEAAQPLVAGDDVGADLLVRRAEVRPAVDVVDGGGQEEAAHDCTVESARARMPYACTAMAWTSLTGRLLRRAPASRSPRTPARR